MHPHAPIPSVPGLAIALIAITLVVLAAILAITWAAARRAGLSAERVTRRLALGLGAWLALTGLVAAAGGLRLDGGVPRVMPLPLIGIAAGVIALRSRTGRALLVSAPRGAVIGFQAFRIAVELVLWGLLAAGAVPIAMTFEGRNLDVITGLTAIPVALVAWGRGRSRWQLAAGWHVLGLALLVNVVVIAVRAMPGPLHALALEPANRIVGEAPFVWLPAFLVPVAALGHIVGLRQALAARRGAHVHALPAAVPGR